MYSVSREISRGEQKSVITADLLTDLDAVMGGGDGRTALWATVSNKLLLTHMCFCATSPSNVLPNSNLENCYMCSAVRNGGNKLQN